MRTCAWHGITCAAPRRGMGLAGAGPRATLGHCHGIAHNLLSAGHAPSLRRMLGACRDTVVGQHGREHRSPVPGRSTLRDARGITTPNAARLHNRQIQPSIPRAATPPEPHMPPKVVNTPATAARAARNRHTARRPRPGGCRGPRDGCACDHRGTTVRKEMRVSVCHALTIGRFARCSPTGRYYCGKTQAALQSS
jgi:hypothetical protein